MARVGGCVRLLGLRAPDPRTRRCLVALLGASGSQTPRRLRARYRNRDRNPMADFRPKALWRRLEQIASPPSADVLLARAQESARRGTWPDVQTALQQAADVLGPTRRDDPRRTQIESLRLIAGAHLGLVGQVETAAARLIQLDLQDRPEEVTTLRGLRALGDALLTKHQTRGAAALGVVAVGLLGTPEDARAYYLAGRLMMAQVVASAGGRPDPEAAVLARQAQGAFAVARDKSMVPEQKVRATVRLAELALRASPDPSTARATAQRLLADVNPYGLEPRGRLIYALTFLGSAATWKRIRALDMLDALADRLGEEAAHLLQQQLAALDVCALSALELDRLQAATKRLLPAALQTTLAAHLARWSQIEAARRSKDVGRTLALWEEVIGAASKGMMPALEALAKGEGFLGDAKTVQSVDVRGIADADAALGCALLSAALGQEVTDLEGDLLRAADPTKASAVVLRPLALLVPSLLAKEARGEERMGKALREALRGAARRYLEAGFAPGYGLAAFAELLLRLDAPDLAATAAAQAITKDFTRADSGRVGAIVGGEVRRAVERGDLEAALRWLEVLRDPSAPVPK